MTDPTYAEVIADAFASDEEAADLIKDLAAAGYFIVHESLHAQVRNTEETLRRVLANKSNAKGIMTMGGDSPIFDVAGTGAEFLAEVMRLGCRVTGHSPHGNQSRTPGKGPIVGFHADTKQFTLFWTGGGEVDNKVVTMLPASMTADQVAPMVVAWLNETANYGTQPDHDGDNGRGWRVRTGSWGKAEGFGFESFLSIEPWWEEYGK